MKKKSKFNQCYFSNGIFKTMALALMLIMVHGTAAFAGSGTALQEKSVSGKVIDNNGESLPGVSVLVKGTTTGTITDVNGEFTLKNVIPENILVFSFIGMETQEIQVGDKTRFEIIMETSSIGIEEVVAIGYGTMKKSDLTGSVTQVRPDNIANENPNSIADVLRGKPGLSVGFSSSAKGGGSMQIRGQRSVYTDGGHNDPLIILDGMIFYGELSEINPDDIEQIDILKDASAASVYGAKSANGVIIITTKKGKKGKINVTFSSTATFENIIETPDLQFSYGSEGGSAESWSTTKGNYASNYVDDFFETGYNLINTVTLSGGSDKMTTYFSYGNTGAGGVVPNNTYQKHNVTFKQSLQLLDNLKITSNVMLTSEKTKNRATAGYYLNPIISLYTFPRDLNFADYKENYQYFRDDRNMMWQNWFVEGDHLTSNPYWLINKQPREDLTQRAIASVAVDYEISEKLKFQARGSYDYANKTFDQRYYAGGNTVNISKNGRWDYQKYNDKQLYGDAIFTYTDNFEDLSLNVIAGTSYQKSIFGDGVSVNNGTNPLLYPNEFYFQNIPDNVSVESTYDGKIIKKGLFGNIQLGYKEMLFLDLSGRNDWSSTLALTGNESYFYPSVGVSGILTEMFNMPEVVSFAKVRASGSQVNNEVPWGLIQVNHTINSNGSVDRNTVKPFTDAKPEQLVTLEFGTDWRFYDGRLGLDFTYYHVTSTNQALSRPLSGSEQDNYYTSEYFNAGKIINKGVEIVLTGKPVDKKDFAWNTTLNFSKNNNEVVELDPNDLTKYIDLGTSEGYYSRVFSGGSIGDMYGYKFKRNDAGQIMLDEKGKPLKTPSEITYENRDEAYLGSLEPDFSLGWSNNFEYKQFSLSFLINAKVGGKAFSQTESILDGWGVSQRTADARDLGYVPVNAIQGETTVTQMNPNTYYTTVGGRNGISEAYVYDRTNIRLTQLALSYNFDVQRLGLPVQSASVSLVGQNLFFFYKKAPFDPELGMSTDMQSQSLDNFSVPATRSYGFNLKFTF